MAAWSQADIDKLQAAILALSCGEMVQRVRYDGPPARDVTYQPADLEQMKKTLAWIEASVARASGRASYILASTRKGL